MKTQKIALLLSVSLLLLATACDKKNPEPVNEEELITTLKLAFAPQGGGNAFTVQFQDLDGDGGNAPTRQDSILLQPNRSYAVTITLLNESDSTDVEDVTLEVKEEDDEHLFCFDASSGLNLTINRTDTDGTYPVGLATTWTTGAAAAGTLNVTLRHQPDGIKDGTCTPGEPDISVTFGVAIR